MQSHLIFSLITKCKIVISVFGIVLVLSGCRREKQTVFTDTVYASGSSGSSVSVVDPAEDAPTVADQSADPGSLLNTVKAVLALRHSEEDLQADAEFSVVCSEPGRPFVYRRGSLLLAVNPNGEDAAIDLNEGNRSVIFSIGTGSFHDGKLTVGPQSFLILQ